MIFKEQAESCRRQAAQYVGRPEAPFLLSVAKAFDELAGGAGPAIFAQIGRQQRPAARENVPA